MFPADSIEANVESADVNVQNATQQLSRAADYQVNSADGEKGGGVGLSLVDLRTKRKR